MSAPVVSIMVRSLEKLGFLKRERAFVDRRTFQISLTERGAAALRRLYYGAIVEPFLEVKLKVAFAKKARRMAGTWKNAVWRLETLIREFRQEFGFVFRYANSLGVAFGAACVFEIAPAHRIIS